MKTFMELAMMVRIIQHGSPQFMVTKRKQIPEVILIAAIRLATRTSGIIAVPVKGSVYEAMRTNRLLLSIAYEKRPGCAPRVMYRPTRRGLALLRKYEKKIGRAA